MIIGHARRVLATTDTTDRVRRLAAPGRAPATTHHLIFWLR